METTTEQPTRDELADSIATLKVRHDRLPVHYVDARQDLMDEIEALVDDYNATPA